MDRPPETTPPLPPSQAGVTLAVAALEPQFTPKVDAPELLCTTLSCAALSGAAEARASSVLLSPGASSDLDCSGFGFFVSSGFCSPELVCVASLMDWGLAVACEVAWIWPSLIWLTGTVSTP